MSEQVGAKRVRTRQEREARHREMMELARANPEGYAPRHVEKAEAREIVHGTNTVGKFNDKLALLITRAVGTMWCAYLFLGISLISFPQALAAFARGDSLVGVTWLSQSFLQLVLLPIIIVGQNVISAAQDERASADHETLTALHTLSVQELRILEQQERILELLRDRRDAAESAG